MATIYRRGRSWWAYSCKGEKRLRWSLGTTNERVARQKLKKIEYQEATGDLELPTVTPLDAFLESFCEHLETIRSSKSLKNDLSYLRTIFGPVCSALEPRSTLNHRHRAKRPKRVKDRLAGRHIQVLTLEELTPARIDNHIIQRIKVDGISPKTANRIREVLHVMFNFAIRQWSFRSADRRFPNPVDAVARRQEDDPVIRFLTLDQVEVQLETLSEHRVIQAMVATYIYAGLRREEALWLTHQDVDLRMGMIRVCKKDVVGESWRPKTRRNRRVPVSSSLRACLDRYDPPENTPWFFPSPHGKRWDPDNFSQSLRERNRAAGLSWSCLDFRHTFGSHLAMKGESLYKISALMGNSPEICRRHYAALIPEEMRDTVEFDRQPRMIRFPVSIVGSG